MLPTAITLSNYRSFAEPIRLELRPITLLFGVNNAGKSALLRALPILGDSVAPGAPAPLDLESPAARGATFQDLRWKGLREDDDPDLGLSLHWNDGQKVPRIGFKLKWFDEWRRLVVRRFWMEDAAGRKVLTAEWKPLPEERLESRLTYEVEGPAIGTPSRQSLSFEGLAPRAEAGNLGDLLEPAATQLRGLHRQVQWLEAVRRPPERISAYLPAPRSRLKANGGDAAALLAARPEVLARVSGWYERWLRRRLHISEVPPDRFRILLENLERADLDVDLADTGEGMTQVLPVLAALELSGGDGSEGPRILAIEEPESHLHPDLQRALAVHLCALACRSDPPRLVLETHSEHLLLGVQLQIVTGRLRPEDVVVYWVRQLSSGESVAESVTFDRDARPQGNWPPGIFTEDTAVAREIIRARRQRSEA